MDNFHLTNDNRSITVFSDPELFDNDSTGINLDPSYQRGEVWGTERKQNLIRSLLMGLPIGAIIVNDRFPNRENFPADEHHTTVVDGKQRITAMQDFRCNRLAVPAEFFGYPDRETVKPEAKGKDLVTWEDLNRMGQGMFDRRKIAVCEAEVPTVEHEKLLFDLVNFGGVPQGESDI